MTDTIYPKCLCTADGCRCDIPTKRGVCINCSQGKHLYQSLTAAVAAATTDDPSSEPITLYNACCCPRCGCDNALNRPVERQTGLCKFCAQGAHDATKRHRTPGSDDGDVLTESQFESARVRHRDAHGTLDTNPQPTTGKQKTLPWHPHDSKMSGGAVKADFTSGFSDGKYVAHTQSCRHVATPVFEAGGITYFAGSQMHCEDKPFDDSWLVVSLLGRSPDSSQRSERTLKSSDPKTATQLGKLTQQPGMRIRNWISVDWTDQAPPPVKPEFWKRLHQSAKSTPGVRNVLFFCMGGHGRTGTAIVSAMIAITGKPATDATTFVRTNYCKRAVESKAQHAYLQTLFETLYPQAQPQPPATGDDTPVAPATETESNNGLG